MTFFCFGIEFCAVCTASVHSFIIWQVMKYIEDIQVFGVNMSFISLSEVKKLYIS